MNVRRPSRTPPARPRPRSRESCVPRHVAIVMDGNGRWAKERGLPRTEGHKAGEASLFDVVEGAIELGVPYLSAYAFSTENWRRSPDEVRFLMGFNRDVIRRRRDELDELGVRVRWAGPAGPAVEERHQGAAGRRGDDPRQPTPDPAVLRQLRRPGRDRRRGRARWRGDVAAGRLNPDKVNEKTFARYLYEPEMPDVDLFVRSSGEQRTSNFLLWQSAYAELVFLDVLWPDFDRRDLWQACEIYAKRDRRYGGAVPNQADPARSGSAGVDLRPGGGRGRRRRACGFRRCGCRSRPGSGCGTRRRRLVAVGGRAGAQPLPFVLDEQVGERDAAVGRQVLGHRGVRREVVDVQRDDRRARSGAG